MRVSLQKKAKVRNSFSMYKEWKILIVQWYKARVLKSIEMKFLHKLTLQIFFVLISLKLKPNLETSVYLFRGRLSFLIYGHHIYFLCYDDPIFEIASSRTRKLSFKKNFVTMKQKFRLPSEEEVFFPSCCTITMQRVLVVCPEPRTICR